MNKRIKELAEQQGLTGSNYLISSQELEKFAELIINNCIEAVNNTSLTDVYTTYDLSLVKSTIAKSIESIQNKFGD